jgi:peptide/nickel transport system ATP-binding protein
VGEGVRELLVSAEGVRVRIGAAEIVAGVTLSIERGQVLGLVGESGSGKTTFCRALLGLLPLAAGEIRLEGRALGAWTRLALRRRAQMLLQDAASSLSPRMTIGALLREPARIHGIEGAAAALDRLLEQLRLPADIAGKYPHEISGGQARRVAIARALLLQPALLVADEPTAGLDVSVQGEVMNLLLALQQSHGLTLLIVSHNLGVIRRTTQATAVMYAGEVVEWGETAAVFQRPAHPYTAALISAHPTIDRARVPHKIGGEPPSPAAPPSGCRFHPRCPHAQPVCARSEPALAHVEGARQARCHFPFVASAG